uniref:ARF GTPase-activating protein GIT2 isoform X8 n=1 Tax=Podarcis muralis TaxID=64176 RepID=UPI0010A043CE|nr:ARF GTPase-activating protein GIT2 isoform X8 [Podarcis muralis]
MSKRLRSSDVCADCSAPDPCWASVNRGVLICDECCSVHRSLGRHISQVRHLKHTPWPTTLLQMLETLYSNGANSIWEHSLLDPASVMSGRRKANPQDKVHPNKAEFIRAKYQMLAFVHRLPCRDDDSVTAKDLSKQLHSSVRTGNLETCLRLLSLGAQANFFHPEKGNTPLHVAAKTGQILQAELLAVYGADPGTQDSSGKTPIDYAKQGGHHELAERLAEIQYELTDRLAFYLCGRKPDHKSGQHFIIPQMADRRLLDLSELAKAAKRKLQSLSNHLFEELAMDVYDEVDRRETDAVWLATQNHSTLVTETTVVPFLPVNPEYSSTRNQSLDSDLSDGPITTQEYLQVKNALVASEMKIQQLMKVNVNLSDELRIMQKKLQTLQSENTSLRRQATTNASLTPAGSEYPDASSHSSLIWRPSVRSSRPMSMYETGSAQKPYLPLAEVSYPEEHITSRLQPFPPHASKLEKQSSLPEGDYDNAVPALEPDETGISRKARQRSTFRQGEGPTSEAKDPDASPSLPSTEDVIRKTEQITKNIQELLRAAQENKHDSYIPCSERIHVAVTEMAALFPKKPKSELVRTSLRLLTSSAFRLHSECTKALPPESCPLADIQLVTQQVIQCAYDIAKAAKQLVTITTKENTN